MNAWMKHVEAIKAKNKKLPLSEVLKLASKSYHKK